MDIPSIGLGTYLLKENTFQAVKKAIELGYRHIDTAFIYKNEEFVGQAIKESIVPRKELWITTKIWYQDLVKGRNGVLRSVRRSLKRLQVDYIDLVLIHGPTKDPANILETWQALQDICLGNISDLKDAIRFIGVSNYKNVHLELLEKESIKPYCNQIEYHPFLKRNDILDYCKEKGIKVIAYCSLVQGEKNSDPVLMELSKKTGASIAQILLSWGLQKGVIVIPRTHIEEQLLENIQLIKLEQKIMQVLDEINEEYAIFKQYL